MTEDDPQAVLFFYMYRAPELSFGAKRLQGSLRGNAPSMNNRRDRAPKQKPPGEGGFCFGVRCGARTHDTQNHNLVLYQLN